MQKKNIINIKTTTTEQLQSKVMLETSDKSQKIYNAIVI